MQDKKLSAIGSVLLFAVLVYGVFVAIVYSTQHSLLYYPDLPSRQIDVTPRQLGLEYEEVEIITGDKLKLHGWFVPARQPKGVVLFFHGNAGNISHRLDSLRIFNQLGLSVFIFDYRGYGRSQGRVSERGTYRDAEAAWRYLTEQRSIPASNIIVFGRSLGAAIGAHLAARRPPRALILESAFSSVPDMAAELYPWLPVRWLSRFRYDTKKSLPSVKCPVLIIHSPDDEIIPFRHGHTLYQLAPEPKQFLQIRGGHNDGFLLSGAQYIQGLDGFINQR